MHWILNPPIEKYKDEIKHFFSKVSEFHFSNPDYVYLHQLNKDNVLNLTGEMMEK